MMRIAYLVAGAGGMYCGACMRDNRLAATLIEQGHDVVLLPLYTPIRTDETDVSARHVYYGGINAFLQQKSGLFRHTPWAFDHLLDAPPLLRMVGRLAASTRAEDLGAMTVSVLEGEHGAQLKELKKLVVGLRELQPSLINLPNLMFLGVARRLKAEFNVPILCTLAGEDIFLDELPEPHRSRAFELIRESAAHIDAFIAPSNYYGRHCVHHFDLPADRVRYVPMGVTTNDCPVADPNDDMFTIGSLARICPEKGLEDLCTAVARLKAQGRRCRLRAAGYLGAADKPYLEHVKRLTVDHGLGSDFEYIGEVDRQGKLGLLGSLHAFSTPTRYVESKGYYVLEAMACGVPVVQPKHGAFTEVVEATGGGLLYDPSDAHGLENALARLMDDAMLRSKLAVDGREAVHRLYTSEAMARSMWHVYEECCGRASA